MKQKDNLVKKLCWVGDGFRAFKKLVESAEVKNIVVKPSNSGKIPRDYDAYVIHLSEISFDDLKKLREEQPWSWIYGISGGSHKKLLDEQGFLMEELDSCLDARYHHIPTWGCEKDRLRELLEEIKQYRKTKSCTT